MIEFKLNLREIEASQNVDALLTEEQSNAIGSEAVQGYLEDKQSRMEWDKRMEAAIKLALQMVEAKSTPWPNASNVKFPLVTVAALQFSARAYPALVKVPDLVRYRVTGEDKDGQKASRATRIGRHMSYQLLDQDEQWEEDTDRKFIVLPILGCAFKKTYWDSIKKMNCSRLVLPQNLYVNYYTKSIEECERKTEVFQLSDRQIKAKQLSGLYSEKTLGRSPAMPQLSDQRQGLAPPPESATTPRDMIEQHAYLDLDGDGYAEPYVITVNIATRKVLRIVARFGKVQTEQSEQIERLRQQKVLIQTQLQQLAEQMQAMLAQVQPPTGEEDEQAALQLQQIEQQLMAMQDQAEMLQGQIAKIDQQSAALAQSDKEAPRVLNIEALEHYTKFPFIPSPDGGFYDLGLGALLGPVNDSVNTLINQLIDSGTMQVGSTGFIGKGARIQGGDVRFRPFEWKRVNVAGQVLKDSIVPLPVNQPSNVLFQLLSLLINYGEKISSVNAMMSGENPGQNTPAYNMQAMLEQGMQVFNGIFKRIYRSFRKELRKLYVLNRLYMNPVEYYEVLDGSFTALQNDYLGDEKDIVPASDPNAFSSGQNALKAQFLASRAATVPGYNTAVVERRLLESMDIPDPQEVFPLDEQGNPMIKPPENPELILQAAEEQRRALEAKSRMEINAATAEAQIAVNESQVMMNYQTIQEKGDKILIEEFKAITDRIKASSEKVKNATKERAD